MTTIVFDVDAFRVTFPEFASDIVYPDATLQLYFDTATCYVEDEVYGCLTEKCRTLALNYLTAHIARISNKADEGKDLRFVQSASIDKVSVSVVAAPTNDQFEWWLNLSTYGASLLALLSFNSAGGLYVGGTPERRAFRGYNGDF